jgi:hypothetical protein
VPTLDRTTARQLALATAVVRSAIGLVALAAPGLAAGLWADADARRLASTRVLARALGARDLALGLGLFLALRHEGPVRGWVEAGGLADTGDVVATLSRFGDLPPTGRWLALGSAAGGAVSARLLSVLVDLDESGASPVPTPEEV